VNDWRICWFFTHILLGILILKGLTARRIYKSFGVKGLIHYHVYVVAMVIFITNVTSSVLVTLVARIASITRTRHKGFALGIFPPPFLVDSDYSQNYESYY
jgi:hypothetical protein